MIEQLLYRMYVFFRPNLIFCVFDAWFFLKITFRAQNYVFGLRFVLAGPFTTLTRILICLCMLSQRNMTRQSLANNLIASQATKNVNKTF